MQGNRGSETRPETALRSALFRLGLRFRKHYRPASEARCRVDVAFPKARVAVFMDGCFWHGCPDHGNTPATNQHYWSAKLARNRERDRTNDAALAAAGWTVVRVWEHEDPHLAAERIRRIVLSEAPA